MRAATTDETVRKSTPYDWGTVTDHAIYLGVMPMLIEPDSHNAASDNEEFNYFGVRGNTDKTPEVRMASAGLAGREWLLAQDCSGCREIGRAPAEKAKNPKGVGSN